MVGYQTAMHPVPPPMHDTGQPRAAPLISRGQNKRQGHESPSFPHTRVNPQCQTCKAAAGTAASSGAEFLAVIQPLHSRQIKQEATRASSSWNTPLKALVIGYSGGKTQFSFHLKQPRLLAW